ncbi:MAG: hypothetical protein IT280_12295 [Ignavibacteria bacterium]|nr:hypothetical protein [Ignavibacteria bacterium]
MKKKIILLLAFFVCIVAFQTCSSSDDPINEPNDPSGDPPHYLLIEGYRPALMPQDGEFKIGIRQLEIGSETLDSIDIDITIREYNSGHCLALETTQYLKIEGPNSVDTLEFDTDDFENLCDNNNRVYYVRIHNAQHNVGDSAVYVRGTPNLSQRFAPLDIARMPYRSASGDTIKKSIDSTFDNPVGNLNQVHVTPTYSAWVNITNDSIFPKKDNAIEFYTLINSYAISKRPFPYQNYFLIIGASQMMYRDNDFRMVGVSSNTNSFPGQANWSYVFPGVIDSSYTASNLKKVSIYNYIACHELIHQWGNAFGCVCQTPDDEDLFSDHFYHWGKNKDTCVIMNPYISSTAFTKVTGFYRICDRHIFKVRTNLGTPPPLIAPTELQDNSFDKTIAGNNEELKIKLELAKTTYTKYEPILAKFTIINTKNRKLEMGNIFSPILEHSHIIIEDKNGKKTSVNKFPMSITYIADMPTYIINPGDTLFVTMEINNWGKIAYDPSKEEENNNVYFGQLMYFEPGSYTMSARFTVRDENGNRGGTLKLVSNEINFEVTENTPEEKELLVLYKKGNFNDIYQKFPQNGLLEYVAMEDTRRTKTETGYLEFMNNYPNSYYLMQREFLEPLIVQLFTDVPDLDSKITSVKSQFNNELFSKYLKTKSRIEAIVGKK